MNERRNGRWWLAGLVIVLGVVAYLFVSKGGVETMETFADGISGHQALRTGQDLERQLDGITDERNAQLEETMGTGD